MTYVVVTITYFLLIGFLLWKNEAGTYIRHMTPHHLVCILKTSLSILTEVVLTMSLTFACVYTLCGLRKALPEIGGLPVPPLLYECDHLFRSPLSGRGYPTFPAVSGVSHTTCTLLRLR